MSDIITNIIIDTNINLLTFNDYIKTKNLSINNIYIDKFWNNINNKHWIYIDDVMIEWIGYGANSKNKLIELLKKNFKIDIDYKIYNYDEINNIFNLTAQSYEDKENINAEIIKNKDKIKQNLHNRTMHLIIHPKCFKKILMMIKTKKAEQVREYYIDLEEIIFEYSKYQLDYTNQQLQLKDNQLEIKNTQLQFKDSQLQLKDNIIAEKHKIIIKKQLLKQEQYIYVCTSQNYLKKSIFKIGRTNSIKDRLKAYTCGKITADKFKYIFILKVYDAVTLEHLIQARLKNFQYKEKDDRYNNELFQIDYHILIEFMQDIEKFENANIIILNKLISNTPTTISNIPEFDDIIINNDNIFNYINDKFIEPENKRKIENNELEQVEDKIRYDDLYKDFSPSCRLNKEIINERLKPYNIKMIDEYDGIYDNVHTFQCLSIFEHTFKWTIASMSQIYKKGCAYCKKKNILSETKIYKYKDKTYEFVKEYTNFDDVKDNTTDFLNIQLLKNIINEERWLTPQNGHIYSILSPDFENKLNLNKELTDIEKETIKILEIDYKKMVEQTLKNNKNFAFTYAIDTKNNIIYKSNSFTLFGNNLKYLNGTRQVNRKTIPKHINSNKTYAGYKWTSTLNSIDNIDDYEIVYF